ncbi:hypothetical protein VPNG_06704 [Cytospora leucostoma]|uniref:DUF7730 domain-containing protein n=1 Tax=Cytospora leucostoma TaxID=1230097 RepID=A0A423WTG3_9PEZI|nr:hypothetical protein VPNG_06704 [Cytospora leucostoma]
MTSIAKQSNPKQASPQNEYVVPLLPAERPRRLSEAASARHDKSLRHYGTFGRLPLEVRQQILTEALGGRRLHMTLSFDHPLERIPHEAQPSRWKALCLATRRKVMAMKGKQPQPQPQREQREPKPEGPPTHCDLRSEFVRNKERPQCWQWFGCVCHRREENPDSRWSLMGWKKIIPIYDCCCSGDLGVCSSWPPERRAAECFVGAMAWLLTCRQAYADAIDILYSTNEFHLSDAKLIRNLPRLILPQRLASIRALELVWLPHTEILTHAPGPPGPYDTEEARRWLCNTIPIMFPRLEKLHLSLSYDISEPGSLGLDPVDDSILQAERIILGPVEAMLLNLPHASLTGGLSVAINATFWK